MVGTIKATLLSIALVCASFIPLAALAQTNSTSTAAIQAQINAQPKTAPASLKQMVQNRRQSMLSATSTPALFPPNAQSCFDYFHFGGVQVNVGPTTSENYPGRSVSFVGSLENQNTYPIVGAAVYVKIFRVVSESADTRLNGEPVMDQFVAKKDISIDANASQPFQFSWDIPAQLIGGQYQAVFYIVGNDRFNIMGLSFSDDVSGTKAPFTVQDAHAMPVVAFDKNTVTANGKQYYFAQPVPVFGKDEVVRIQAKIVNPLDQTRVVSIKRSVYNWDSQRPQSLLEEGTEQVILGPKETRIYTYDESKHSGTITLTTLTLTDSGVKSVLNVRFARRDANETRLSFSSITGFPIEKGKENTLFTCTHSTFGNTVEGNEITLALTDSDGAPIHSYTYTGPIVSNMMAVKSVFTPTKSSANFTLTATLKNNGKLVDTFTETYACSAINPSLCPTAWWVWILEALAALLLLGALWWLMKRRHEQSLPPPVYTTPQPL